MPSKLGYWDIRGYCQPIRFFLEYVGEEYEDKQYSLNVERDENGKITSMDMGEYADVKAKMPSQGFDFPNLPHYDDGKVKLTQSKTILRYLGRKYNLDGNSEEEKYKIDLILDVNTDIWQEGAQLFYFKWSDEEKANFEQKLATTYLPLYEKYLGNSRFFAGDNITLVDFHTYEMLNMMYTFNNEFKKNAFDKCPNLVAYLQRFENLPQIKKYMESKRYFARPFCNKIAFWQ